jgi:hypothetical protein
MPPKGRIALGRPAIKSGEAMKIEHLFTGELLEAEIKRLREENTKLQDRILELSGVRVPKAIPTAIPPAPPDPLKAEKITKLRELIVEGKTPYKRYKTTMEKALRDQTRDLEIVLPTEATKE